MVVGSPARGIEALSKLVFAPPEGFSTPDVLDQHLDPDRESRLQEMLSRRSRLPVRGGAGENMVFSNTVSGRTFGDGEPGEPDARQRLGRSFPLGEDGEKPPDDTSRAGPRAASPSRCASPSPGRAGYEGGGCS